MFIHAIDKSPRVMGSSFGIYAQKTNRPQRYDKFFNFASCLRFWDDYNLFNITSVAINYRVILIKN